MNMNGDKAFWGYRVYDHVIIIQLRKIDTQHSDLSRRVVLWFFWKINGNGKCHTAISCKSTPCARFLWVHVYAVLDPGGGGVEQGLQSPGLMAVAEIDTICH